MCVCVCVCVCVFVVVVVVKNNYDLSSLCNNKLFTVFYTSYMIYMCKVKVKCTCVLVYILLVIHIKL